MLLVVAYVTNRHVTPVGTPKNTPVGSPMLQCDLLYLWITYVVQRQTVIQYRKYKYAVVNGSFLQDYTSILNHV